MYVAYKYDNNGYYNGTVLVEDFTKLPINTTLIEPVLDDNNWNKWDGSKWILETKPQSIQEYIDNNISYDLTDKSVTNLEKIARLVDFVNNNSNYVYDDSNNIIRIKSVEESEEKSEIEAEYDEVSSNINEMESQLSELRNSYVLAQMLGDTDSMDEISTETKELLGLTEETDNGTEE